MFNKKAIAPFVSIGLLLLVSVGSFGVMYNFFLYEEGEQRIFVSEEDIQRTFEIVRIEGNIAYIQNSGSGNVTLSDISIGGTDCSVANQTITDGLNEVDIGSCTGSLNASDVYTVFIVTSKGVLSEPEYIFNVVVDGFIFDYQIGGCSFADGYIKVFGLSGLNNSHLENSSSSIYGYSGCAKHLNYTLGTSESGNFITLGHIINTNNSPFFTDRSSPLNPVTDWHNLSLSSSAGIFDINITPVSLLSQNYTCVGKFDRDDTYGAHFGDCYSSHNTTIWVKLS